MNLNHQQKIATKIYKYLTDKPKSSMNISKDSGLSIRVVQRYSEKLVKAGFIKSQLRQGYYKEKDNYKKEIVKFFHSEDFYRCVFCKKNTVKNKNYKICERCNMKDYEISSSEIDGVVQVDERERRKYVKRDNVQLRKAKCGHVSQIGRYFKCEECQPVLPSEDEWLYHGDEIVEDNCE